MYQLSTRRGCEWCVVATMLPSRLVRESHLVVSGNQIATFTIVNNEYSYNLYLTTPHLEQRVKI